jgi:hypothetical protein
VNRHERRALAKNSPLFGMAREVDDIAERILNGSANIRDIRTLTDFEGQLRVLRDRLHPLNTDGEDRVLAMILEINALLAEARELSVVR